MNFVREMILATVAKLHEDNFAFTVEAVGAPWDVYRFTLAGVPGMTAVRIVEGKVEIGMFCKGDFTEEQVVRKLIEGVD